MVAIRFMVDLTRGININSIVLFQLSTGVLKSTWSFIKMISTQSAGNKCSLIGRLNSYYTIWMTDKIKIVIHSIIYRHTVLKSGVCDFRRLLCRHRVYGGRV